MPARPRSGCSGERAGSGCGWPARTSLRGAEASADFAPPPSPEPGAAGAGRMPFPACGIQEGWVSGVGVSGANVGEATGCTTRERPRVRSARRVR